MSSFNDWKASNVGGQVDRTERETDKGGRISECLRASGILWAVDMLTDQESIRDH